MMKEIGSNFWFNKNQYLDEKKIDLNFLNIRYEDYAFISSGRSAITYILEDIGEDNEKIALLPAFTCDTVIEPFLKKGYRVKFYSVNKDLTADVDSLHKLVEKNKTGIIIFHRYFGIDTANVEFVKELKSIKEQGFTLVEDLTQTMYSNLSCIDVDYYVGSFRKWTGMPDGAFAIKVKSMFKYKPTEFDKKLEKKSIDACHNKFLYMTKDIKNKQTFLEEYAEARKILAAQDKIYSIGEYSQKIQANLNIKELVKRRNANFCLLEEGMKDCNIIKPIFNHLGIDIAPLYYPVYVVGCERKALQQYLISKDIYVPVVWPKTDGIVVDEKVEWIYNHILAIPCDQRYDEEDMQHILHEIELYENSI